MQEPFFEATPLCTMVEDLTIEAYKAWSGWAGITIHTDSDMFWTMTDVPFPLFNCVLRPRVDSGALADRVEEVVKHARQNSVPMLWWLGATPEPNDMGARLRKMGFSQIDSFDMMTLELAEWTGCDPGSRVRIEEVCDKNLLSFWVAITGEAFDIPQFVHPSWLEINSTVGFGPDKPLRHFVAYVDDHPAGTATLVQGSRCAGVFSVGVSAAFRGKGIGSMVSGRCLDEAKRRGYAVATLQATPMGKPVYMKMGFRSCGESELYIWMSDKGSKEQNEYRGV